ncbi:Putative aliphatic sulfonate ABC transporter substrate-binding protein [Sinomonas atrocyanea]|uniref:Putative aliphatic sulfonate ABC transporter substrate-binding protein n=1 Tax=Sinomonas atrocyanea TaxID=37927 RepID=A0A127A3D6_9MICC|nr:ABC transporter substrate-binding protein [Sinomonas atrocyanea]AMM33813.1 Putative aliphatic sulfonate ABC transporter substrate-binding protein [Sinomonas atrocyanea]GEB64387.1 sulfonate ABC transporter substrate-binding protein [Sinomonas atrocyanea]
MSETTTSPGTIRITADAGPPKRRRGLALGIGAALVVGLLGGATAVAAAVTGGEPRTTPAVAAGAPAPQLRLGYFANVTHAPALVGVQDGLLAKALKAAGTDSLTTQVFNAGPAAVEALNAGAIDAAYLGPNPAINSFVQSHGESLSVIAGAAAGGAQLVVRPGITDPAQLRGTVLATPQLGGTQDVALRAYLASKGLKTTPNGGGDVTVNPTDNAATLKLFQDGKIDGAWLPEPWASRLVLQAGAKVLVDEKDLWNGTGTGKPGLFPTTILVVNKAFAAQHPQTVEALLRGHVAAVDWLGRASAAEKASTINAALQKAAGAALPADAIGRALANITFTTDPLAGAYPKLLADGVTAGVTKPADLHGLFDLRALNTVLAQSAGRGRASAAGLGQD